MLIWTWSLWMHVCEENHVVSMGAQMRWLPLYAHSTRTSTFRRVRHMGSGGGEHAVVTKTLRDAPGVLRIGDVLMCVGRRHVAGAIPFDTQMHMLRNSPRPITLCFQCRSAYRYV